MIDSEPIRLVIYLSLALLVSTCMSTIWVVRNTPIRWVRIPHVKLAMATLALVLVFLLLLAVSIRDMHWIPRSALVWPIVATSGGASVLGWSWWLLTVKMTFRIVPSDSQGTKGLTA